MVDVNGSLERIKLKRVHRLNKMKKLDLVDLLWYLRRDWTEEDMIEGGWKNSGEMLEALTHNYDKSYLVELIIDESGGDIPVKKLYRVPCTMTSYLHLDVEAYNEDEAWDIAIDTDGGCFVEEDSWNGGWEINGEMIEEVTDE